MSYARMAGRDGLEPPPPAFAVVLSLDHRPVIYLYFGSDDTWRRTSPFSLGFRPKAMSCPL
jgi:hypothetical protein